jgi:hypothetical protein
VTWCVCRRARSSTTHPTRSPKRSSRTDRDHQQEEGRGEQAGQAEDRTHDEHVHEAARSIRLLISAGGSRHPVSRGSGADIFAQMQRRCPLDDTITARPSARLGFSRGSGSSRLCLRATDLVFGQVMLAPDRRLASRVEVHPLLANRHDHDVGLIFMHRSTTPLAVREGVTAHAPSFDTFEPALDVRRTEDGVAATRSSRLGAAGRDTPRTRDAAAVTHGRGAVAVCLAPMSDA